MARPFADRLGSFPVVLEVVPPSKRASDRAVDALVARTRKAIASLPGLDAVNLPEILEENHRGRPYYRNTDPRAFAGRLGNGTRLEVIVNKVVAHTPRPELEAWLAESFGRYGVRNVVLVGGSDGQAAYPGPSVPEADRIAVRSAAGRADVAVGNILIAERRGEVERLVAKTRAGASFFTTQVLFEPEPITSVLRGYGEACAAEGLAPGTVLLSFAPVSDAHDLEFLVWLGARVSAETEEALLAHPRGAGDASLEVARSIGTGIAREISAARVGVPLGVNVEEIAAHNFDLAVRMARLAPEWRREATPVAR
jgi:5,10-methylenetetrahydrofolate reductase